VAYCLTSVFACSVALMFAAPAGAQVATRTAQTQSMAVLPFCDLSGLPPDLYPTLGEDASAAVAVELRDRLLVDVLPRADVNLVLRDLGMTPPLSDSQLVRMATELEVDLVVDGQIRQAEIHRSPEGRYAEVVLAVRVFDRVAQADVNGALTTARGPASMDLGEEALLRKAVEQAAFQAVQEMRSRPSVLAMVLWARDDVVFLNVGSRGGIKPGMRMVAIRAGQRIGLAQVTEADALGSYATILEGPPLRTGDHMRAVYVLPIGVRPDLPEKVAQSRTRIERLALAAAALIGVADLGSTSRMLLKGDHAMPAFTVSNLANQAELWYNVAPTMVGAALMTWRPYSDTEATRIAAYEIYAGGQLVGVVRPTDGDFMIWSDYWFYPGFYWEAVLALADNALGTISWSSVTVTDDDPSDVAGLEVETDTYGATSITYRWLPIGPITGVPYVYRVRPVVLVKRRIEAGVYEWRFERETEWSSPRNYIMTVGPPFASHALVSPGNIATFFFYSPIGADEAIVQVARDPYNTFPPDRTYQQTIPGVWTDYQAYALHSVQVNLNQVPGTGNILWWRVGARNREDPTQPRPWPLDRVNDYGWVWSQRERLVLLSSSLERASEIHRDREALARARVPGERLPQHPRQDRVLRTQDRPVLRAQ